MTRSSGNDVLASELMPPEGPHIGPRSLLFSAPSYRRGAESVECQKFEFGPVVGSSGGPWLRSPCNFRGAACYRFRFASRRPKTIRAGGSRLVSLQNS